MLPIVFEAVGDKYVQALQITSILWFAETSDGDQVLLTDPTNGAVLWQWRTNDQYTCAQPPLGSGISAPNGIRCSRIDGTGSKIILYARTK